jgi:hypothetical protein
MNFMAEPDVRMQLLHNDRPFTRQNDLGVVNYCILLRKNLATIAVLRLSIPQAFYVIIPLYNMLQTLDNRIGCD